jgi:hypothetical protein
MSLPRKEAEGPEPVVAWGPRRRSTSIPWAGVVALLDEQGMRDGVVVQAGDMPERKRQAGRGLAVRRVENTILGGMLVSKHVYVESRLYGRNRTFDLHLHAIACTANYGKAVGFRELNTAS